MTANTPIIYHNKQDVFSPSSESAPDVRCRAPLDYSMAAAERGAQAERRVGARAALSREET